MVNFDLKLSNFGLISTVIAKKIKNFSYSYLMPVILEGGLCGEVARVVDVLQLLEDVSAGKHIHLGGRISFQNTRNTKISNDEPRSDDNNNRSDSV